MEQQHLDAVQYLSQHGKGLHGLGDSEFAISKALVDAASAHTGFVQRFHDEFTMMHSSVADKCGSFRVDEKDELHNYSSCQQLCGRFCRSDITNPTRFYSAMSMLRNIARLMNSKKDVKNGNAFFLSPSCQLPVLLITTPTDIFGRLVYRVSFNPLEVDFIHCSVHTRGESFELKLLMNSMQRSTNLGPITDTMVECAIWLSLNSMDGWSYILFTSYDISVGTDFQIKLLPSHTSYCCEELSESNFSAALPARETRRSLYDEDEATAVACEVLALLENKKRKPRSTQKKSTSTCGRICSKPRTTGRYLACYCML